jgi:hypothetical protein
MATHATTFRALLLVTTAVRIMLRATKLMVLVVLSLERSVSIHAMADTPVIGRQTEILATTPATDIMLVVILLVSYPFLHFKRAVVWVSSNLSNIHVFSPL